MMQRMNTLKKAANVLREHAAALALLDAYNTGKYPYRQKGGRYRMAGRSCLILENEIPKSMNLFTHHCETL